MHLNSLVDSVASTCTHCAIPYWMTPATSLFSMALGSQETGFDILYAAARGSWNYLPDFWIYTLRLWTDLHMACETTDWKKLSQTAPFWNNFHLLFGSTHRPLIKLSIHNALLLTHGRCRQQDFVEVSTSYATHDFLENLLNVDNFPAQRRRQCLSVTLFRVSTC